MWNYVELSVSEYKINYFNFETSHHVNYIWKYHANTSFPRTYYELKWQFMKLTRFADQRHTTLQETDQICLHIVPLGRVLP